MMLVGNGYLITRNANQQFFDNGCVAIQDGVILEFGTTEALRLKYADSQFIDAQGSVIMPGLINTHMHLYSSFARGMALKDASPGNFVEILERLWWRLDRNLRQEDVIYSALVALIECVKNGTTTIFDHHASPECSVDSLFWLADAVKQVGLRASLSYEVSDRNGAESIDQGIAANLRFVQHCQKQKDPMIRGMFGLHASFTLGDATLKKILDNPEIYQAGIHVHVAEDRADVEDCLKRYGLRVVERLHQMGMLGANTLAVHCVHINENEIELLLESGTPVIHNPESNMGNAVGCAPVLKMMAKKVAVGLGTDGYTCDMFESLKVANLLHKFQSQNPSAAWQEPHTMLFQNNSAIASQFFGRKMGEISVGACADLIIVDYTPPTTMNAANVNGHVLFGMSGRSVVTTIVNGKILMLDRKLTGLDEKEICARARELADQLWLRF